MADLTPRRTLPDAQLHAESLDFTGCITVSGNIRAQIQGAFDAWEVAASATFDEPGIISEIAIPISRALSRRITAYREQWSAIATLYDRVAFEKLAASLSRREMVQSGGPLVYRQGNKKPVVV